MFVKLCSYVCERGGEGGRVPSFYYGVTCSEALVILGRVELIWTVQCFFSMVIFWGALVALLGLELI